MMRMSFIDKLKILLDIIKSSKLHILISIILLLLYMILITINKKNSKKKIFVGIYIILIGAIIFINRANLVNMFDYMMNNFFIIFYFPNLAIYLAAIIISNIIMLTSLLSKKMPHFIKNINITLYSIMTYLLVLVLNIIKENKLDVFTKMSVYGNRNAQAIIELSSIVFIIWIAFLIIYKTLKTIISSKVEEKEAIEVPVPVKTKTDASQGPVVASENAIRPLDEKKYRKTTPPRMVLALSKPKPSKIYKNCEPPRIVIGNIGKQKQEPIKINSTAIMETMAKPSSEKIYRKIESPRIAIASSKPKYREPQDIQKMLTEEYENLLTLDDYKLLLNILKEQKVKEQQIKDRQTQKDKEQEKFRELQRLYGTI